MFLHSSLKALDEVDLRTDFDMGQLPLFDGVAANDCLGMCGN